MNEAILVAIISGCFTIAGVICSNYFIGRQKDAERSKWEQRMEDRYESIKHRLEEHNNYAQKITSIEQNLAVITERLQHMGGDK